MLFQERTTGEYKIYAGAVESARGGYVAAVVIQHACPDSRRTREVFRDESLACGHSFRTAQEALDYAMGRARDFVSRDHAPLPNHLPRAA